MTDTELDEMLDQWDAPRAPASLRENVRAQWPSRQGKKRRVGLWALAGIAAALLIAVRAFPQKFTLVTQERVPYIVDSEFVRYAADGLASVELISQSYSRDGREVILSKSLPGDPWGTLTMRARDFGLMLVSPLSQLTLPFMVPTAQIEQLRRYAKVNVSLNEGRIVGERAELLSSGCELAPVIGHQAILGYTTAGIRRSVGQHRRLTVWMAPRLGCYPLRALEEQEGPDGTFHALLGREARRVTLQPPQARH